MDNKTGLYVFLGVLCILAIVLLISYFTDYIIQPAPPAKVLLPMGTLHAPTSMQRSVIPILPFTSSTTNININKNNNNINDNNNVDDDVTYNASNTLHDVEGKAIKSTIDENDRQTIISTTITDTSNK